MTRNVTYDPQVFSKATLQDQLRNELRLKHDNSGDGDIKQNKEKKIKPNFASA